MAKILCKTGVILNIKNNKLFNKSISFEGMLNVIFQLYDQNKKASLNAVIPLL